MSKGWCHPLQIQGVFKMNIVGINISRGIYCCKGNDIVTPLESSNKSKAP